MTNRSNALTAIAFLALSLYLLAGLISFQIFVEPSLDQVNGWRVYGDSDVYMDVATHMREDGVAFTTLAILSLSRNLILPALEGAIAGSWSGVVICNAVIFMGVLVILGRTFTSFRWHVFLPLVLLSPNTYQSIFTLNKEIFVFSSAAMIARWMKFRSPLLMMLIVALSLVLRWEQAFVIICFLSLIGVRMPLRWALVGSIAIISVAYPLAITQLDLPSDPTKESSSALFAQINILQSYGLYFVLLIPKLVITLLSQVVRFWKPISEPDRIHDLNNGLFVILDQLSLCLVLLAATVKKLWKTNGYLTYFCAICAVIYLSAPENSPRYLYILFVLLAIALAAPELQNSLSSRRAAILGLQLGNGQGHKSEWECPR